MRAGSRRPWWRRRGWSSPAPRRRIRPRTCRTARPTRSPLAPSCRCGRVARPFRARERLGGRPRRRGGRSVRDLATQRRRRAVGNGDAGAAQPGRRRGFTGGGPERHHRVRRLPRPSSRARRLRRLMPRRRRRPSRPRGQLDAATHGTPDQHAQTDGTPDREANGHAQADADSGPHARTDACPHTRADTGTHTRADTGTHPHSDARADTGTDAVGSWSANTWWRTHHPDFRRLGAWAGPRPYSARP